MACEEEVVVTVNSCQMLEKRMGRLLAAVEHVVNNIKEQRSCAM
jgi:hypothetical protein